MSAPIIWYLIKFFTEERHADQFMTGDLYLNTLDYFKKAETKNGDGRIDSTEAVAAWLQPDDIRIKLNMPGIGDCELTKKDLAGPVCLSFDHHNFLHLFCMYAIYTTGYKTIDGKIDCTPGDVEDLQRQVAIDERCLKLGRFAVITPAAPFLVNLKKALKTQKYKATWRLVEYYDNEVFNGMIPMADIPFMKQKRFSYQREFRLCVDAGGKTDSALTINMGDLSHICVKVDPDHLPGLFQIKTEPIP